MKKIIAIGLWVLGFAAFIALAGFAAHEHGQRVCETLNIQIERENADMFLQEDDVKKLLSDHGKMPVGQQLSAINIYDIEKLLLTHPAVESCEAFMTVSGDVNIRLKQRRPIARIINAAGESYYIDDQGMLMQWSEKYTAHVVLVNGYLNETYGSMYTTHLDKISIDTALTSPNKLDDAWQIVKRIEADSFLRAQIVQVNLTRDQDFILIPRIGDQVIRLGDISTLDEKLEKLKIFYSEGLKRSGRWTEYSVIDLQYKDQIVCTKKKNNHGI